MLPRSNPRDHGVSSRAVQSLLAAAALGGFELHSLMLLRHGHVVAEGWWHPYAPDGIQLLYSLSKSFTSTAVGLAQAEGLLAVEDRIVDLLPDKLPAEPDAHLRALRVRDCLAMATGHRTDVVDRLAVTDPVAAVLGIPAEEPPGGWFTYNQGATLLLSAVIARLSGGRLLDYLRPRLLRPLGITQANWKGIGDLDQGFSGLHLVTESVARLGQLYLQGGRWQGRQLLPAAWVAEATRRQVDSPRQPEVDWRQGYGYQFWMSRHGYRGDGACGQFCLILPEQEAVLVTTAATTDMQGLLNLVWHHLLPGLGRADSAADDTRLARALADLSLPTVSGSHHRQPGDRPTDVTGPEVGSELVEKGDGWVLTLPDSGRPIEVGVGFQRWVPTAVRFGEHHLLEVSASGAWQPSGRFRAELICLRTPHRLILEHDPTRHRAAAAWNIEPLGGFDLGHLALDERRS